MEDKKHCFTMKIPMDLFLEFKYFCKQSNTPIAFVLIKLMKNFLKQNRNEVLKATVVDVVPDYPFVLLKGENDETIIVSTKCTLKGFGEIHELKKDDEVIVDYIETEFGKYASFVFKCDNNKTKLLEIKKMLLNNKKK